MVKGMLSEEMEVKAAASEVMRNNCTVSSRRLMSLKATEALGHQGLQNYTEKYTKVDDEKRV
ncbi:hypothetical protein Leryth_013620 [Lithospermum erythrorhizon]|nr:hypothetical protein Leryth_013620 [Lithospermum erythrorhizon]